MSAPGVQTYPEYAEMTAQQIVDARHKLLANYRSWPDAEPRLEAMHREVMKKPPPLPGARRR